MTPRARAGFAPTAALLFFSGAAAFVYELAWARWLTLTLGASAEGLAIVTASTMVGFAAGAAWLAPRIDASRRPLRTYGSLEIGIGISAGLASTLLHLAPTASITASLPRPLVVVLLVGLVSIPTALMGATLPAVLASVRGTDDATLRARLSRLYAANTAGAVVGTLVMGFVLVESLGYIRSAALGCAMNVIVGAIAIALDHREHEKDGAIQPETPPLAIAATDAAPNAMASSQTGRHRHEALFLAAVSGFTVLAHEVLSSRLLVYGLFATSHALAILLATYLAGLAIGARLVSGPLARREVSVMHLGAASIFASAITLAFVPALGEVSGIVTVLRGNQVGYDVRLAVEAMVAAMLLLPSAIAMGTIFPLAAAFAVTPGREGHDVGRAVLVNTLAGAVGSLGAAFFLIPLAGVRGAIAIVTFVSALAGAFVVFRTAERARAAGFALALGIGVVGATWLARPVVGLAPGEGALVPQHVVDHEAEYAVRCHREGPSAITEVLEHLPSGRVDVLIDGFVAAGSSASAGYMRLMGDLPMALHSAPHRALVICFGTGTTTRAVVARARAASEPGSVDVVDINPDVIACAGESSSDNADALAYANVHVQDGRAFLRAGTDRFDVITQEPMPPHFAGVSALYSVEYYELARARLEVDGILLQWLPMHLTAPDDARAIAAASLEVFAEVWIALAPGDYTGLVVMSPSPLASDARARVEAELGIQFVLDRSGVERFVSGVPPVTDDRPRLEHNGIDRVLGQFRSATGLLEHNLGLIAAAMHPRR